MSEKKSAKAGRNSDRCKAYRSSAQREANQLRRLLRHAKRGSGRDFRAPLSARERDYAFSLCDDAFRVAYARCQAVLPNAKIKAIFTEQHIAY